jgi:hypothetical protein
VNVMNAHDPNQTATAVRGHRDRPGWRRRTPGVLGLLGVALLAVSVSLALPDRGGISRAVARAPRHAAAGSAGASRARARAGNDARLLKLAQVKIALAPGSRAIALPRSYLGLSIEYWGLPRDESHPHTFARVLSLLRVAGDGPMILRIGGDSADRTYWDPRARRLRTDFFGLTPGWLSQDARLVRRQHLRVILDLNVVADSPPMAARWARAALDTLPRRSVLGFEIGNEPDLYHQEFPYRLASERHADGAQADARTTLDEPSLTPSFSISTYVKDFRSYARALAAVRPHMTLLGPAVANPQLDFSWVSGLIGAEHRGLGMVTAHRYPLSECELPGSPRYPTIPRLLSERSSTGLADGLKPAVLAAHRAGLLFRLTELNSVTCGGRPKVSDSFATALWAPDALFELLRVGVDGVNVHIRDDAINAPFTLSRHGLDARPLIYGLALFARALGPNARLVALHVHVGRRLHVKLWGVRVGSHLLNVVAINKGARTAGVHLALPARGTATVQRLMAPSVRATSGVRLDGQWLDRQGRWRGRRAVSTIAPSRGVYELALPGASAALVSLHLRYLLAAVAQSAHCVDVQTRRSAGTRARNHHRSTVSAWPAAFGTSSG